MTRKNNCLHAASNFALFALCDMTVTESLAVQFRTRPSWDPPAAATILYFNLSFGLTNDYKCAQIKIERRV